MGWMAGLRREVKRREVDLDLEVGGLKLGADGWDLFECEEGKR